MRQAWHWLGRWQDPLSVGATVTLVGLVYLMPASSKQPLAPLAAQTPNAADHRTSQRLPTDPQYYRDQWIRETAAFYALHPPRRDERPTTERSTPVATTARVAFQSSEPSQQPVTQAAHVTTGPPPQAPAAAIVSRSPATQSAVTAAEPPHWIQRWRITASLGAGLLAGLMFVAIWPAAAIQSATGSSPPENKVDASNDASPAAKASPLATESGSGEVIAIRLPAAWVGVRPTMSESLRRVILAASYLLASLCGWNLLS